MVSKTVKLTEPFLRFPHDMLLESKSQRAFFPNLAIHLSLKICFLLL